MEQKKWWKESVVYQIYPRSFMDSNNDGIGDIKGITSKLDYLKTLGVDILWISPIFKSPNVDMGYDISDYQEIMDTFGTIEDFDELLSEAHNRDLKIIIDLVVNHSSNQHPWFIKSKSSKDNPYHDYYIWKKGKDGKEPNNWGSYFSGPAWTYDKNLDMYYLHLFASEQPDLNWENEKLRKKIYDMMIWWCEKGIDGFRMDVINLISKDPEFPDYPTKDKNSLSNVDSYVVNGPKVHEYLEEMNREVLSKYDLITVGETPSITIDDAKKYAGFNSNTLNMVFQFEHTVLDYGDHGKWTDKKADFIELKAVMSKWQTGLEGEAWNSLYWNNHDQPRVVSRFGNDSLAYQEISAKMLATCLHMMKGTPYIYQGEELGMTNIKLCELDEFRDIEAINAYHDLVLDSKIYSHKDMIKFMNAKGRDNVRTPMQWDDSEYAGFSAKGSWIQVNPNYKEINAKKSIANKNSVFHYYKKLIELRKTHDIIVYGSYKLLEKNHKQLFIYERTLEKQKLLVICNFTDMTVDMPIKLVNNGELIISNYSNDLKTNIRPYESKVYLY